MRYGRADWVLAGISGLALALLIGALLAILGPVAIEGVPRIDVHTVVQNTAEDHRLRAHFPSGVRAATSKGDQHFGVVERPIALPAWDRATWMETPLGTYPQKAFASVDDGANGLTIGNSGLPEYEAIDTAGGAEIAVTLMRCAGWLSRADIHTRRGGAGPQLRTPGAQLLGTHEFDYCIIPHAGDWESCNAHVLAVQHLLPVDLVVRDPVELLFAYEQRFGAPALRRYGNELLGVLEGTDVTRWLALSCFDAADARASEPAADPDPARRWTGRGGRELAWRELDAPAGSSFVDLTALIPEGEAPERALAYAQAWLFSEDPRAVACTLGTDDGCRVWLDEELVYENRDKKRANPLEKLARLELQPGWNRLVFQVENATGSFGLYCRVLDPEVLVSSEPR